MFVCIATKPLNDRTKGFRFNVLGLKGLTRKRQYKRRGWSIHRSDSMLQIHMGLRSIYFEQKINRKTQRRIHHFAG
jgi:hypothetical protein